MNKRAEIWTSMRAWLATGATPDNDDLEADLTGPAYHYGPDQVSIQLERKVDMKRRGLPSPDDADALACTFAEPIMPTEATHFYNPTGDGEVTEYNHYSDIEKQSVFQPPSPL